MPLTEQQKAEPLDFEVVTQSENSEFCFVGKLRFISYWDLKHMSQVLLLKNSHPKHITRKQEKSILKYLPSMPEGENQQKSVSYFAVMSRDVKWVF